MTRIVLFTGKGGVGKTTVAAGSALRAAARGARVLVCSADPAHSLGDALDRPLGDAVEEIARYPGGGSLAAQELDARRRWEEAWGDVREFVTAFLDWAGADAVEAEELAVFPGLDEIFVLSDVREHATSGDYDLVVVDCAPTAETLRLLTLPDVAGWYMERVFPKYRLATRAVRPILSRVLSAPVANDRVLAAVQHFSERLAGVRTLLGDARTTSARLVVNPERVVLAEARRTYSYLALFGYHVDAVVANRVVPDDAAGPFADDWRARQAPLLAAIHEAFADVPVLVGPLRAREPVGFEALLDLAGAVYGERDPAEHFAAHQPFRVERSGASLVLSLHLPDVERDEVELSRCDGELLVAVGPYRRAVALPDSLERREVASARLAGGRLEVTFDVPRRATVGA